MQEATLTDGLTHTKGHHSVAGQPRPLMNETEMIMCHNDTVIAILRSDINIVGLVGGKVNKKELEEEFELGHLWEHLCSAFDFTVHHPFFSLRHLSTH